MKGITLAPAAGDASMCGAMAAAPGLPRDVARAMTPDRSIGFAGPKDN